MTKMRLLVRSPVPAVLVLLVLLGGLVGGCAAGSDAGDGAPSESTTTASEEPAASPTEEASTLAPAVAAVCTPFSTMVTAIKDAAMRHADPDKVASAIAPVMKEFAALVPDLERPPGMPLSTWRGIGALAERILALPDRPSYRQIEAVERQLTAEQRGAVEAAVDWFKTRCEL